MLLVRWLGEVISFRSLGLASLFLASFLWDGSMLVSSKRLGGFIGKLYRMNRS